MTFNIASGGRKWECQRLFTSFKFLSIGSFNSTCSTSCTFDWLRTQLALRRWGLQSVPPVSRLVLWATHFCNHFFLSPLSRVTNPYAFDLNTQNIKHLFKNVERVVLNYIINPTNAHYIYPKLRRQIASERNKKYLLTGCEVRVMEICQ
jgi:hypothetical protein